MSLVAKWLVQRKNLSRPACGSALLHERRDAAFPVEDKLASRADQQIRANADAPDFVSDRHVCPSAPDTDYPSYDTIALLHGPFSLTSSPLKRVSFLTNNPTPNPYTYIKQLCSTWRQETIVPFPRGLLSV